MKGPTDPVFVSRSLAKKDFAFVIGAYITRNIYRMQHGSARL